MIQATQLDGTWCCALDSIWGSRSTAPGQGKVATCGRASSLCLEEQASRQCQRDSSRLAKGVRETTKGLCRQYAARELTTPQCPVLMHLVRVAPTTSDTQRQKDQSGMVMATQSRRPPRLYVEKASSFYASGCSLDYLAGGSCWILGNSTTPTRVQGLDTPTSALSSETRNLLITCHRDPPSHAIRFLS